jgi:hypothetical protein
MSNDRSTITIPDETWAAILDAVQRVIVDKYAAKATRNAALSALLALIEAGAVAGDTSINSPARDARGAAVAHTKTLHGLISSMLYPPAASTPRIKPVPVARRPCAEADAFVCLDQDSGEGQPQVRSDRSYGGTPLTPPNLLQADHPPLHSARLDRR